MADRSAVDLANPHQPYPPTRLDPKATRPGSVPDEPGGRGSAFGTQEGRRPSSPHNHAAPSEFQRPKYIVVPTGRLIFAWAIVDVAAPDNYLLRRRGAGQARGMAALMNARAERQVAAL